MSAIPKEITDKMGEITHNVQGLSKSLENIKQDLVKKEDLDSLRDELSEQRMESVNKEVLNMIDENNTKLMEQFNKLLDKTTKVEKEDLSIKEKTLSLIKGEKVKNLTGTADFGNDPNVTLDDYIIDVDVPLEKLNLIHKYLTTITISRSNSKYPKLNENAFESHYVPDSGLSEQAQNDLISYVPIDNRRHSISFSIIEDQVMEFIEFGLEEILNLFRITFERQTDDVLINGQIIKIDDASITYGANDRVYVGDGLRQQGLVRETTLDFNNMMATYTKTKLKGSGDVIGFTGESGLIQIGKLQDANKRNYFDFTKGDYTTFSKPLVVNEYVPEDCQVSAEKVIRNSTQSGTFLGYVDPKYLVKYRTRRIIRAYKFVEKGINKVGFTISEKPSFKPLKDGIINFCFIPVA